MRASILLAASAVAALLAACGDGRTEAERQRDIMSGRDPGDGSYVPPSSDSSSPATPGPTPIGPTGSQGQPGIPVTYGLSVVITNVGDRKISVIQAVMAARGIGLAEAKQLVEASPAPVASGLSAADATALQNALQAAGATVSIQ